MSWELLFRFAVLASSFLATLSYTVAVTPESPEVRELVDKGLKYLEENSDHRLGGKCLSALAFYKSGASLGAPTHCRSHSKPAKALRARNHEADSIYSNGLAIIFLCELNDSESTRT